MTSSSLADIIRIHDEARSNSTALEYEGRSITFGDVQARACQMAQALLSLGVKELRIIQ
jgi:acyl-coenzyme A synthetase/AMP-(fatty) acid ligase